MVKILSITYWVQAQEPMKFYILQLVLNLHADGTAAEGGWNPNWGSFVNA